MTPNKIIGLRAGETFYSVNRAGAWATRWRIVKRERWADGETHLLCLTDVIANPTGREFYPSERPCWHRISEAPTAMLYTMCHGQAVRWASEWDRAPESERRRTTA